MSGKAKKNSSAPMVEALTGVLVDSYVLMVKTHGYHWNVTGMEFNQLHAMFETQYNELFAAVDELAERIRALGAFAPMSMAQMLEHSEISETGAKVPSAKAMISDLVKSHEKLVTRLSNAIDVADDVDDDATEDMLIGRKQVHEKTLWMLRSLLEG